MICKGSYSCIWRGYRKYDPVCDAMRLKQEALPLHIPKFSSAGNLMPRKRGQVWVGATSVSLHKVLCGSAILN